MTKQRIRTIVGIAVILVHAACFFIIFFTKDAYLSASQQIDIALLFMPVTATYCAAVVRSAMENPAVTTEETVVNANYAVVVVLITSLTLLGLLWTVVNLTGNGPDDRHRIIVFEIVFGASFGLVAADLFGKIERIAVPRTDDRR